MTSIGTLITVATLSVFAAAQTTGPAAPKDRAIRGGVERVIKTGDLVCIPPGVPHGIKESKGITYLNIRFEARTP